MGNATTIYDERGNVLSEHNELGEITLRTYPADDNVLPKPSRWAAPPPRSYDYSVER